MPLLGSKRGFRILALPHVAQSFGQPRAYARHYAIPETPSNDFENQTVDRQRANRQTNHAFIPFLVPNCGLSPRSRLVPVTMDREFAMQ